MTDKSDPLDSILSLEDEFYKDGYNVGVSDGKKAGLVEGRFFGFEKGFEKYAAMGRLHGKATIWAGRLPDSDSTAVDSVANQTTHDVNSTQQVYIDSEQETTAKAQEKAHVTLLPKNPRLEAHIRTLYALTEPDSLSTENTEDSVSEFDDRLKRAEGKFKVTERLIGEPSISTKDISEGGQNVASKNAKSSEDGSIEDISSLHVRH